MLKDVREFLANELQNPETQREFIIAFYEEDGIDGLRAALEEIAHADAVNKVSPAPAVTNGKDTDDLNSLRATLNAIGLDLGLLRLSSGELSAGLHEATVAI